VVVVRWPEIRHCTLIAHETPGYARVLVSPRGKTGHPIEWVVPRSEVMPR
jgi:hypothetical protein